MYRNGCAETNLRCGRLLNAETDAVHISGARKPWGGQSNVKNMKTIKSPTTAGTDPIPSPSSPECHDQQPTAVNAGVSTTTGLSHDTLSKILKLSQLSVNVGEPLNLGRLTSEDLKKLASACQTESDTYSNHLASVGDLQRSILEEEWKRKFGVSIGCLVLYNKKIYKVSGFYGRSWQTSESKPWLRGILVKKDGTTSTHRTTLYNDWEIMAQ